MVEYASLRFKCLSLTAMEQPNTIVKIVIPAKPFKPNKYSKLFKKLSSPHLVQHQEIITKPNLKLSHKFPIVNYSCWYSLLTHNSPPHKKNHPTSCRRIWGNVAIGQTKSIFFSSVKDRPRILPLCCSYITFDVPYSIVFLNSTTLLQSTFSSLLSHVLTLSGGGYFYFLL